jgi:hypothetical protein
MRKLIGFGTILGSLAFAIGCSDDDGKTVVPTLDAGTPAVDSGTPAVDSGTPAADSGTPAADSGTTADAGPADAGQPATCPTGTKPTATFKGNTDLGNGQSEQTTNITLTADKDWELDGQVFVKSGATLTIEPCVTIKGKVGTAATIIIKPGAMIMAKGEANRPIVFTSGAATKRPGDVGGIIVLGRAPVNQAAPTIEGLPVSPETTFGGTNPADNSGTIEYVRLEYGGVRLGANNEINGLTLGGVGSGTTVRYVQVRHTLDDCFEFFGGTVNADHLVCTSPQDDAFDWDWGFSGKLQHLVLQQGTFDDEMNGFEADNDAQGTDLAPISNPTISNVTLCGRDMTPGAKRKYGMLLRRNTGASIRNVIAYGFDFGIDVRDAKTHLRANGTQPSGTPSLAVTSSLFFKFTGAAGTDAAYPTGTAGNPAIGFNETSTTEKAFNEFNWLSTAASNNVLDVNPELAGCKDASNPNFNAPAALYGATGVLLTKAAVTTGMQDANAKYIGAFKDANDKWATTGAWVKWTPEGQ